MAWAPLAKIGLSLLALPATCMLLCSARIEPVHGWMLKHKCPIAEMTMHRPSRTIMPSSTRPSTKAGDEARTRDPQLGKPGHFRTTVRLMDAARQYAAGRRDRQHGSAAVAWSGGIAFASYLWAQRLYARR